MALRLNTPMPSLDGVTLWVNEDASKFDLSNKTVIVHFWGVSCHTCKDSMPAINELKEVHPDVVVIGIHMPRSEKDTDIDLVKDAILKNNLSHAQGIDNEHIVVDAFENEFVPAFYLFDQNGLLRHRSAGEHALSLLQRSFNKIKNA